MEDYSLADQPVKPLNRHGWSNPTGEARKEALRVHFDSQVKLEFHGAAVTSDAGLAADPAMRQVVDGRARDQQAAATSQRGRFETQILTAKKTLKALMNLPGMWFDRVQQRRALDKLILDLESSVSEIYGRQEGSAYNGHFECTCYHPIFCFNHLGDLERALLRNGNLASADEWHSVLEPVVARYCDLDVRKYFRGDAAFAIPELYSFLEDENYEYTIRLKSNAVLERQIRHLLTRQVGRPPKKPVVRYHGFLYQAASWDKARRVVAKVELHQDELLPRVGSLVTNLPWRCKRVVRFYNQRGTAEQWIKEGKNAVKWTKLSCHDFVDNQVRLQLFALAYHLGNFLRRLVLPRLMKHWTMTTLREKLIKIGAKVVQHARYVVFQMAEVAVPRKLFAGILERIQQLGTVPEMAPS